jgi:hypothetical protein
MMNLVNTAAGLRKAFYLRTPFADSNFLKKAFLEAFVRIGLFDANAEEA